MVSKERRNLRYRLVLARLSQLQGQIGAAVQILQQAETDLGPSPDIQLARLDCLSREGGDAAKSAVAKLAATRDQLPPSDRQVLLDRLGATELRLGEPTLARQYWRELAVLQPRNINVHLSLFDLALTAGDRDDAAKRVDAIREVEGSNGTAWRFAEASLLIDRVRRGERENEKAAAAATNEITVRRPKWPGGYILKGELAELAGSPDEAIANYLRAIEQGSTQPSLVRRLVHLLNERGRFDEIDAVARVVRSEGAAVDEITMVKALEAIRKQDFDRGITLARQVFGETSTIFSDHLALGRAYAAAGQKDQAGKEFRRAVELGPEVPQTWVSYVEYLVQTNQMDQAHTLTEQARKAVRPERLNLTLAQCALALGETKRAEALVEQALNEQANKADLATLQLAASIALSCNRRDKMDAYLRRLEAVKSQTPGELIAVKRLRIVLLASTGRPGDRARELALAEENLQYDPSNPEDQRTRATLLALQPRARTDAIVSLERMKAADRLFDNERFLLAQLYLAEGAAQKYQDEMQKILAQRIKDPRHLAHFIDFCIERNDLDQADRWLAEFKKLEHQGLAVLLRETQVLDRRNRKVELLRLLQSRARMVPQEAGAMAELMKRYGFVKEAEAAYRALIGSGPSQPELLLDFAKFLCRQDRAAEAMEVFKKAAAVCPSENLAAAACWSVYDTPSTSEADKHQVETWVTEAVRKQPQATLLASKLAVIRFRQGRLDDAESLFRRLVASDPTNAEVLNNLAWLLALRDARNALEALVLIERAIGSQGPTPGLLDTRGVVLIQAKRPDEAVADLLTARRNDARDPGFAFHLAWAYEVSGRRDQARQLFDEAQKLGLKPQALDPLMFAIFERLQKELSTGRSRI